MIPPAVPADLHLMHGKLQAFTDKFRYFFFAAGAPGAPAQALAIHPPGQAQVLTADRTRLIHGASVVLGGGPEEEVRIADLVAPQVPGAVFADVLGAFPLVGKFVLEGNGIHPHYLNFLFLIDPYAVVLPPGIISGLTLRRHHTATN